MENPHSNYYYSLGRHQAAMELNDAIPKSCPVGIEPENMRDWLEGYSEMIEMYAWRRDLPKNR